MSLSAVGAFAQLGERLGDFLWPRTCAVEDCGRPVDRTGRHICSSCLATLPFHETGGTCRVCGLRLTAETHHDFLCEACQTHPPAFARACSALVYDAAMEQLIQSFKYRHATYLTEDFTDWLEAAVRTKLECAQIDVVVPVPVSPARFRKRGYNQSELLACALAARLNRRVDAHALIKTGDTGHQARRSGDDRRAKGEELVQKLEVPHPEWIRGRTVLLVDDVMTTGSTFEACARVLRAAGAGRIWCASVARAVLRG